jgi:hypothetical protein
MYEETIENLEDSASQCEKLEKINKNMVNYLYFFTTFVGDI